MVLLIIFVQVYIPFYLEFVKNCISTNDQQDTFLTNVTFTAAYNTALEYGNLLRIVVFEDNQYIERKRYGFEFLENV